MDGSTRTPFDELDAMKKVIEALDGFDANSAERILRWAAAQSGSNLEALPPAQRKSLSNGSGPASEDCPSNQPFSTIADLFAAAAPQNGPENALVAGYWFQVVGDVVEFDAKSLNDQLKHLGRPLSNVTATLTSLINQRPTLVMQTQKIGRGAQGRKRYKLTQPGIDRVRRMLAGNHNAENGV